MKGVGGGGEGEGEGGGVGVQIFREKGVLSVRYPWNVSIPWAYQRQFVNLESRIPANNLPHKWGR